MMKAGTQTGSLMNHLYSRAVVGEPIPEVGMGCTLLMWSDRIPGTIVEVLDTPHSKTYRYVIEVAECNSKVISGSTHDGSAKYEFTDSEDGYRRIFRKSVKDGFWHPAARNDAGRLVKFGSLGIRIGAREQYVDPSH